MTAHPEFESKISSTARCFDGSLEKLRPWKQARNGRTNIYQKMKTSSGTIERLGKSELGPHAFEPCLPDDIYDIICREDESNNTYGIISILNRILQACGNLEVAYLCNSEAVQVSKLPKEGGHFCGYRNIQMLWLGLASSTANVDHLSQGKPSVPMIQEYIEKAWDNGFNAHGRLQTGGIRGTRKHIGTSEAEAILLHRSIPCTGKAFHGRMAWSELLDNVEAYFASSASTEAKIKQTSLPPIFLQRPHHSMTIVGIERTTAGRRRLLVFDPAWRPTKQISRRQSAACCPRWSAYWTLKRYRKGERYLRRFEDFETLEVDRPG